MKKVLALLTALVLLSVCSVSCAANLINGSSSMATLSSVSPFKFEHRKTGIGWGTCPVYSAPYTNAYRAANGKASVDTNSYVDIAGFSDTGWLLVRYTTNSGLTRVGWIPPKYRLGLSTSMTPHFVRIPQTADEQIEVTENCKDPYNQAGYFAVLEEGESYDIIGRYNYYGTELWFIEFYIDGQPADGFIIAE